VFCRLPLFSFLCCVGPLFAYASISFHRSHSLKQKKALRPLLVSEQRRASFSRSSFVSRCFSPKEPRAHRILLAAMPSPIYPPPAASLPSSGGLADLVAALSSFSARLSDVSSRVPGSAIAWRYLKASHQDDPLRTVLEVLLVFFIVRTYLSPRTKGEGSGKNFVKLSEKVRLLLNLYIAI
jgi:hypothetical protein